MIDYLARCLTWQRVKTEHQKLGGFLQPLPILMWKWEHITWISLSVSMNEQAHDAIWVVVNRLIKVAHYLALKVTFTAEQLAGLYIGSKTTWDTPHHCVRS